VKVGPIDVDSIEKRATQRKGQLRNYGSSLYGKLDERKALLRTNDGPFSFPFRSRCSLSYPSFCVPQSLEDLLSYPIV